MKDQDNTLEQDDRFPSGPWRGFWLQDGYRGQMDLQLDFQAGQVSGRGSDPIGEFVFSGTYSTDTGRVLITKQYIDQHTVHYEGWAELQHGIWGLWNLVPNYRGGWQIRPLGHGEGTADHAEVERPHARELTTPAPRK